MVTFSFWGALDLLAGGDLYTLFDGLAYNTCGYFASCAVFFRTPRTVSLDFVSGNIVILGKQNSLFPSGPVTKCLLLNDYFPQLAIMEEATKLRESATDVAEAMAEIEGYMQRIKDIAVEVSFCPFISYLAPIRKIMPDRSVG